MSRPATVRRVVAAAAAFAAGCLVVPVVAQRGAAPPAGQGAEAALVARARAIHDRVITLDTHDDINASNFELSRNYTLDLGNQVNLPKMKAGGLDVSFFIVYVGQSSGADAFEQAGFDRAYQQAYDKFEAVHRLTKVIAPDQIGLALTPADVRRIAASGRKVAVIGVENGYPIGRNLNRVREFWERGARYMSDRPHLKWVDGFHRGYVVVDLQPKQLQADWYFIPTVTEKSGAETRAKSFVSEAGAPRLMQV